MGHRQTPRPTPTVHHRPLAPPNPHTQLNSYRGPLRAGSRTWTSREAYRLNIGLTKASYESRFGTPPTERDEHGVLDTGFDYSVRDELMPNPMYASQHWVCVVNPSEAIFQAVRPLLAEAYQFAVRKYGNQSARQSRDA